MMHADAPAIRLLDRAATRLQRFWTKRRLEVHRAFANAPYGTERLAIDGMQFDLNLNQPTDLTVHLKHVLPGGKDRRIAVQALSEGDVVFDIGANVGYFAVEFARAVGPTGRLYAFEPNPSMNGRLRAHLALNSLSNVTVVPAALGSEAADMELFVPPGNNPGAATLVQDWRKETCVEKHRVPVIRLDEYVQRERIDRVDFIKLDVEGFESEVLKGAQETLRRFRPRLMVEVFRLALEGSGQTTSDLLRQLESLGYDLYKTMFGYDRLFRVSSGLGYGMLFEVHCLPACPGEPI